MRQRFTKAFTDHTKASQRDCFGDDESEQELSFTGQQKKEVSDDKVKTEMINDGDVI